MGEKPDLRQHCCLVFLLVLLLTSASDARLSDSDGVIITQANYQGLQAFKHALVDPKRILRSWNDTGIAACSGSWLGIKCARGRVIAIQLPWRGLGGKITDKIGQLSALRKLNLHDNHIGGQIPGTIGFLSNLKGLYLFNNRLSGTIPPSIANCHLLHTLDLSHNFITGTIPNTISSARLYRVNLSYNNLSGVVPVGITQSPTLTFLSLAHNGLSGPIPDTWGDGSNTTSAHQLQILRLDCNSFSGPIPVSLSRLLLLQQVSISNNRISGSIPEEFGSSSSLSKLQSLDLSGNSISGAFPASLSNLSKSLVFLNLDDNLISGQLPETIDGLRNISTLSLKNNRFNGSIPATIGNLTNLSQLDLSDNGFSGSIPSSLIHLSNMTSFNVSNNNLSGPVPLALTKKFNSSSFWGNIQLCGYSPSVPCPSPPPPSLPPFPSPPSPPAHHRKLSTRYIILIAVGVALALLLLICFILLCCLIKKRSALRKKSKEAGGEKQAGGGGATEDAGGKLVHFDGPLVFTADDLLCATAEIMGKSSYGTVYRATLEDGNQVAVKRLREKIAKGQREFEAEVNGIGKIRHQNLLALRAYYLGPKGEKLLVFDYMPKGSLAAFLHARGPDSPISWPTRMNIAMGTARGLSHLHNEMNMIHGNLTTSNILLDEETNPKISDFGLSRLMTSAANSSLITAAGALGYRPPELSKLKKASTKTDVYSLGVVILELLTGKSPGDSMNGVDLPQWVASIVKEEWTNEVFDLELMRDAEGPTGDELLNTLKLALHCVDPNPTVRPEVRQVLQQLEEIKPELAGSGGGSGSGGGDEGAAGPSTTEEGV